MYLLVSLNIESLCLLPCFGCLYLSLCMCLSLCLSRSLSVSIALSVYLGMCLALSFDIDYKAVYTCINVHATVHLCGSAAVRILFALVPHHRTQPHRPHCIRMNLGIPEAACRTVLAAALGRTGQKGWEGGAGYVWGGR